MTDKEVQIEYDKLKQIDKFAKELGITIYNINYSFKTTNNDEYLVQTPMFDNKLPDKWKDKTYYLDEEQRQQVKKIDEKIRKMNDDMHQKVKRMFRDIGLSAAVYHDFSYDSLKSIKI